MISNEPLLIINEVLYDPPNGDAGDANGDGTREAQEMSLLNFIITGVTRIFLDIQFTIMLRKDIFFLKEL